MFRVLASGFFFRVSFAGTGGFARVGAGGFFGTSGGQGQDFGKFSLFISGAGQPGGWHGTRPLRGFPCGAPCF